MLAYAHFGVPHFSLRNTVSVFDRAHSSRVHSDSSAKQWWIQDFPEGGGKAYYLTSFSRKLHEKKKF